MIKTLSADKLAALIETIASDPTHRFRRAKVSNAVKGKLEIPAPTASDPDGVEFRQNMRGVIIVAAKNFYQSPEEKQEGKEVREKRDLLMILEGESEPTRIFLPPTSVSRFDSYITALARDGIAMWDVVTTFEAEKITGKSFTYTVVNFSRGPALSEEEAEYVEAVRKPTYAKHQQMQQVVDDDAVAAMFNGTFKPATAPTAPAPPVAPPPTTKARGSSKLAADDDV